MRKAIAIRIKIKEICHSHRYTQKQLAELTGLREADISEMGNNQRTTFNKEKLCILATALQMDLVDLVEFIWAEVEEPMN
jgi:transcriptional regulator with XRE-family HTH domain